MKNTSELEQAQALLDQKRYVEAIKIYEDRANAGESHSQVVLGWMYFEGSGIAKDVEKAFAWFNRAASLGSKEGAFYAGRAAMALGRYQDAVKSFQAAARQEYGPALLWLGLIYTRGLGGDVDFKKGVDYLRRSEQTGNRFAQREIALLTLKGKFGVSKIPLGLLLLPVAIVAGVASALSRKPNDQMIG